MRVALAELGVYQFLINYKSVSKLLMQKKSSLLIILFISLFGINLNSSLAGNEKPLDDDDPYGVNQLINDLESLDGLGEDSTDSVEQSPQVNSTANIAAPPQLLPPLELLLLNDLPPINIGINQNLNGVYQTRITRKYHDYEFKSPNLNAFINGDLDENGILSFGILTKNTNYRGSDLFNSMISSLGSRTFAIKGKWRDGTVLRDNWVSFERALNNGFSPEEAATRTFTGKMATRNGYTRIKILSQTGTSVEVLFSLPEEQWVNIGLQPPDTRRGNINHFHFDRVTAIASRTDKYRGPNSSHKCNFLD